MPCMLCCPCPCCRPHIVLLLNGKKIQTQINKARTLSLEKKANLTNAKEMNRLFDCFVAYLNVACNKLPFYQFMNSWRKYLMTVPNHSDVKEWIWQQNCQRNLLLKICWFPWSPLTNEDRKVTGDYRGFWTFCNLKLQEVGRLKTK